MQFQITLNKKGEGGFGFLRFYFRLLRMSAAAAATIITTATAIPMYAPIGTPLVGGTGDGVLVVAGDVTTGVTGAADGAEPIAMLVSAAEL